MPTGFMLASASREVAELARGVFSCDAVRCYVTEDGATLAGSACDGR